MAPIKTTPPTSWSVVDCRFPRLPGVEPGKKRRVLVIASGTLADGTVSVMVCYGTGQRNSFQASEAPLGKFQIELPADPDGAFGARLDETTRFDLKQWVGLQWDTDWFPSPPKNYGRLNTKDRRDASTLWDAVPK